MMNDILDSEIVNIEAMEVELDQLLSSYQAIETFGSSPSSLAMLQIGGLLNGTALDKVGLEGFITDSPDGVETAFALESIADSIKEKSARWAARIAHFIKTSFDSLKTTISAISNKINDNVSALVSLGQDKLHQTADVIKAHPYKTALAVAVAIGVVATMLTQTSAGFPKMGSSPDLYKKFMTQIQHLVDHIHWPFGKIKTELVPNGPGVKLLTYVPKTNTDVWGTALPNLSKTPTEWSIDKIKTLGNMVQTSFKSFGNFLLNGALGHYQMATSFGDKVTKATGNMTNGIVAGGMATVGVAYLHLLSLYSVYVILVNLTAAIIGAGMRYINQALNALRGNNAVTQQS